MKVFKKMNIGRVIDIDNNSHGMGLLPSTKTAPFCAVKGRVISIALFHLLTIKNDPEVSVRVGYLSLRRMLSCTRSMRNTGTVITLIMLP